MFADRASQALAGRFCPMKTLLFLCTGNYYRSRYAEIYFNWHADQRALAWRAESRGLELHPGNLGMMSVHTVARLGELGIPITGYRRAPLAVEESDFDAADHVIAVKRTEHFPLIQQRFPSRIPQVEFWEVHDLDCAGPDETMPGSECFAVDAAPGAALTQPIVEAGVKAGWTFGSVARGWTASSPRTGAESSIPTATGRSSTGPASPAPESSRSWSGRRSSRWLRAARSC